MQNHDLLKFTATLIGIGELYDKNFSKMLINIYWQSLKCFKLQDVKQAFEAHINNPETSQYFPKPADLVRLIEGSGETKALQAWTKVEKAINHIGTYQSVVFDDPVIHAVLEDIGGWIKLCLNPTKELPFRAVEFQKLYMNFLNKPPKYYPKYCCGFIETVTIKNGPIIKPRVILVGDLKKAKQVMFNGTNMSILIHSEDDIN